MRNFRTYLDDIIRKPPMLYPFVALFHLFWLGRTVWTMRAEPFGLAWLQVLWMVGYTVFWLGVCDLRKWGAFGYIGLTALNILLFFALKSVYDKDMYTSSLFLVDILFSFFILFFYNRLES